MREFCFRIDDKTREMIEKIALNHNIRKTEFIRNLLMLLFENIDKIDIKEVNSYVIIYLYLKSDTYPVYVKKRED
jgi:hypothetical protein